MVQTLLKIHQESFFLNKIWKPKSNAFEESNHEKCQYHLKRTELDLWRSKMAQFNYIGLGFYRFSWNILIKGVTAESINFTSWISTQWRNFYRMGCLEVTQWNDVKVDFHGWFKYRHHFFNFQLHYKFEEPLI